MIYALLILLSLLAALLLLPIGIELDYSEQGRRWALVWAGIRIRIASPFKRAFVLLREKAETADGQGKGETAADDEQTEGVVAPSLREVAQLMSTGIRAFERGVDLVRSFSRHLRVRVHRLEVRVATPDPALTGCGYGMLCAFGSAYATQTPWTIDVDFRETKPAVSFRVSVMIQPVKMMPAIYRVAKFAVRQHWGRSRRRRGNEQRA